jgi:phosphoribosylanthranilate isomerase
MVPSSISPVQIKVCGLTRQEDVVLCRSLGIDWVGFNFWPQSKRYVVPASARPLIEAAGGMKTVGVFVNPTLEEVKRAISVTGIEYAQLHGHEPWDLIQAMPLPVIKALSADDLDLMQGLPLTGERHPQDLGPLRFLLIDSPAGAAFGGTGKAFDWSRLRHRNLPVALPVPYFLAGGLGPGNITEALSQTRPFAVDLNSKVESAPGFKEETVLTETVRLIRNHHPALGKNWLF